MTVIAAAGAIAAIAACAIAPPPMRTQTAFLLGIAIIGGLVRIPLPLVGRLSFAYPILFATFLAFGSGASVLAGALSAAAATLNPARVRSRPAHRAVFNIAVVCLSTVAAAGVFVRAGGVVGAVDPRKDILRIAAYALAFTASNLGLVAIVSHLAGEALWWKSLRSNAPWAVPGFAAGSVIATVLGLLLVRGDVGVILLAAAFAYLMELTYRARTDRAEAAEGHLRQSAELYRSVTRALALAIEAKDQETEEHLRRVHDLSLGIAALLGVPEPEREALGAAALLHDIGKLAVPEFILTKPGRLTPDEMDKLRIHPQVGADILGAVPFPYPLAPIVRHHHERWDGRGYPDHLAGEAIPLGARILTLVDCFDALTTDRPYRKAVGREEAIGFLRREAGRSFDPALVETLAAHVNELDAAFAAGRARSEPASRTHGPLAENVQGILSCETEPAEPCPPTNLESRTQHEMSRILTLRLDMDETLTLLSAKLARLVRFRTLVVYLFDDDRRRLIARFTTGVAAERISGLSIAVGERLSGWAALHQRAYGDRSHVNPLERDGSRSDLEDLAAHPEIAELRSALAAPITTGQESLGVLTVYDTQGQSYSEKDRRLLLAVAVHFAEGLRGALRVGRGEWSGLTDPLTGLPNWRFYLLEARQRLLALEGEPDAFGLVAFHVDGADQVRAGHGPDACDRLLGEVALRLVRACAPGETVVRIDGDRFALLTGDGRPRVLAARSLEILRGVQEAPAVLGRGVTVPVRLRSIQVGYPADGSSADELLRAVDSRFGESGVGSEGVSAFPGGRWGGASGVDRASRSSHR